MFKSGRAPRVRIGNIKCSLIGTGVAAGVGGSQLGLPLKFQRTRRNRSRSRISISACQNLRSGSYFLERYPPYASDYGGGVRVIVSYYSGKSMNAILRAALTYDKPTIASYVDIPIILHYAAAGQSAKNGDIAA